MSTVVQASVDRLRLPAVRTSRLIIGTGKIPHYEEMKAAHQASGAEMVTVAVRRVPLDEALSRFLII